MREGESCREGRRERRREEEGGGKWGGRGEGKSGRRCCSHIELQYVKCRTFKIVPHETQEKENEREKTRNCKLNGTSGVEF